MDIIALFFLGVFLYGVFYVTWKKKRGADIMENRISSLFIDKFDCSSFI